MREAQASSKKIIISKPTSLPPTTDTVSAEEQTMRKKRALAREKNVIFFKLGAFMYLGEKKCVEEFPEATSHIRV
jgi:fucose permease